MSTFTLNVPSSYPWVIGVAAALPLLNIWQILQVVDARKKAGVKYPQIYATKEEQEKSKDALVFNCTQRAHQNTLEYLPHFVLLLLISGLRTPRLSTVAGAIWILGRIVYTLGYASTNPKARQRGAGISYIGIFTLLGANLFTVFTLLREIDFQF